MPARLTYFTGLWEPRREALSKEVDLVRRALAPTAPVVSFSQGQRSSWQPRDHVIRLFGGRWLLFRALAAAFERRSVFSHVFGEVNAWPVLRALGRRPILFTAAIDGPPLAADMYGKVTCFAAESEPIADVLVRAGVPASRIQIVYPGVDLAHYRPAPCPADRFRVLFASSPAVASDLPRRGIPLMVEAARRCPDVEIVLLWRQWGRVDECVRALQALDPPPNLRVELRDVADMAVMFQSVHATIFVPMAGHGKSCPNSIVEGLACGRPAVVSRECGIAQLVEGHGAGVVLRDRTPEALADALGDLRRHAATYARQARALAERRFSVDDFIHTYGEIYEHMSSGRLAHAPRRTTSASLRSGEGTPAP